MRFPVTVLAVAVALSSGAPASAQPTDSCKGFSGYEQPLVSNNFGLPADAVDHNGSNKIVGEASAAGGTIVPFDGDPIAAARIWGFSFELGNGVNQDCDVDDQTPFDVIVYPSTGGVPGAPLSSASVVATLTEIGVSGPYTAKRYDFSFAPPLEVAGGTWISFQRQAGNQTSNGNECVFAWLMTDLPGFDATIAVRSDGAPWETSGGVGDASLCLDFAPVPVELQSFSVSN